MNVKQILIATAVIALAPIAGQAASKQKFGEAYPLEIVETPSTLTLRERPALFISGTASIVGHRSLHLADVEAQTRETFVNLRAVIQAANSQLATPAFALETLGYTIYVRHATDVAQVKAEFLQVVGTDSGAAGNAVFLHGDVCRAELLVEIEATSFI